MAFDMNEFRGMFFDEVGAHLAAIDSILRGIDPAVPRREDAEAIYRAAHSIKGASASFGFDDMAEVARAMEDLLAAVRSGEASLGPAVVDVCLGAWKALRRQLAAHRQGATADDDVPADICERLKAARQASAALPGEHGATAEGTAETIYDLRFAVSRMMAGSDVLIEYMLEKLGTLGVPAVRSHPDADEAGGAWWIEIRTARPESELREVLDLLIEPGSLHVERRPVQAEAQSPVTVFAPTPDVAAAGQAGAAPAAPSSSAASAADMPLLTLRVGAEIYALPAAVVRAALQPAPEAIRRVGGVPRFLEARGECLPVVDLGERLRVPGAGRDWTAGVMVVAELEEGAVALFADALLDCLDLAVEGLERHFRRMPGFAGAALLPEGRVVLVLDVAELVRGLPPGLSAAA